MGIFSWDEQPDWDEVIDLRTKVKALEKRIEDAKALIQKAISECKSEEKLGSMDGAVWSEAFRTRYFEKILGVLDPPAPPPPPPPPPLTEEQKKAWKESMEQHYKMLRGIVHKTLFEED